jgi:hypothetical protein
VDVAEAVQRVQFGRAVVERALGEPQYLLVVVSGPLIPAL